MPLPEAGEDRRVTLRAGALSVELAPACGGRLSALRVERADGPTDIIPPLGPWRSEPRSWPKEGAYPLFPYSNRIRDAKLLHAGRVIALRSHPLVPPHAIHGTAHLKPWTLVAADAASAEISLDFQPDEDWPWAFEARQAFALSPEGLTVDLSICNRAEEPAPAGIGWHPYFVTRSGSDWRHDGKRLWRLGPDTVTTGEVTDYAGEAGDNLYLSRWTRASLIHPDGSGVVIEGDPALDHLILHRPAVGDYACIEPVSHAADGFNLAAKGVEGTGTVILQPGETLEGTVRLRLLPETPGH